ISNCTKPHACTCLNRNESTAIFSSLSLSRALLDPHPCLHTQRFRARPADAGAAELSCCDRERVVRTVGVAAIMTSSSASAADDEAAGASDLAPPRPLRPRRGASAGSLF